MGQLKQLLLATFHHILLIKKVICVIQRVVPGTRDSPMECSVTDDIEEIDCDDNNTTNIPEGIHTVKLYINNGCEPSTTHCQLSKENNDYMIPSTNTICIDKDTIKEKYNSLIKRGIQDDTKVYITSSTDHELYATYNSCFKDLHKNHEFTFDQSRVDYPDRVNVTDNSKNTTFTLHFIIP